MAETTWSDGDVATAALLNSIEDQTVNVTTSGARPTGAEGRMIFETDTNQLLIYDGSTWNIVSGSDWVTYTPSLSGFTLGNGTVNVAQYHYVPGGQRVRGYITLGSTSSVSGALAMTIPNSESWRSGVNPMTATGSVVFIDADSVDVVGVAVWASSTTVGFKAINASATYAYHSNTSASVPFTWTTGDIIAWDFTIPI